MYSVCDSDFISTVCIMSRALCVLKVDLFFPQECLLIRDGPLMMVGAWTEIFRLEFFFYRMLMVEKKFSEDVHG